MILNIKELHKTYPQLGTPIEVLKGVNLNVEKGTSVAILGQSGSGKSTLLSLLAGLDAPTSGDVMVQEHSLPQMSENELSRFRAKHLGIIFQQFHLMSNLTALENVALPLEITKEPDAVAKAREALTMVGLGDRLSHFPSKLSGGESQRVAIARAFVVKPSLLLADEPSGNLDAKTGNHVMELIFNLAEQGDSTLVLVTHNLDLAKKCNKILELKDGKLSQLN